MLIFLLALFSVVSSFIFFKKRVALLLVYVSILLAAACRFEIALPGIRPDSITVTGISEGQELELSGVVNDFPEFFSFGYGTRGAWGFTLNIQSILNSNVWKSASGKVDVRVASESSLFSINKDDEIVLSGLIDRNRFPSKNIYQVRVQESDVEVMGSGGAWSLVKWGRAWRDLVALHLEKGLDDYSIQESVLKALVLGDRKAVPADLMNVFRRTGSFHIFAISGLHVGIVGFFLVLILKTLCIPRDKFGILLIPLLTFYVISTGMKASAVRALLMATIFLLAPLLRRKPDIPSSVALAAALILIFRPLEILSVGFIFSFSVVAFLVMVFSSVPKEWVRGPWIKVYPTSLLITTFAAGLASIPLAALFFGLFSPIALVGNLIVVPLTFCIVLCGWLSILLPMLSQIFNQAAVLFIDFLLDSVQWLDRIPGSSYAVEPPPLLAVLIWYACLISFFTHCSKPKQRYQALAGALGAVGLALWG
ncbi:MAG: ComEC/Rec2 family competence protein [Pontiella sp.]